MKVAIRKPYKGHVLWAEQYVSSRNRQRGTVTASIDGQPVDVSAAMDEDEAIDRLKEIVDGGAA